MTVEIALKEFGNWIRKRREVLGIRRSELASRLGWKNLNKGCRRICSWENGTKLPPHRHHESIIQFFELRQGEFLEQISRVHFAVEEDRKYKDSSSRNSFQCEKKIAVNHALLLSVTRQIFETPAWRDITIPGAHTGLMYFGGVTITLGGLLKAWEKNLFQSSMEDGHFYCLRGGGSPLSGMQLITGFYRGETEILTLRNVFKPLAPNLGPAIKFFRSFPRLHSSWSLSQLLTHLGVVISDADIFVGDELFGVYNFADACLRLTGGEEIFFPFTAADVSKYTPTGISVSEDYGPPTSKGRIVLGNLLTGSFGAYRGDRWDFLTSEGDTWRIFPGHIQDHHGRNRVRWNQDLPPLVIETIVMRLATVEA